MDQVTAWKNQGLTLWQIVRKTGYPRKIVVALLANPHDARALNWVRRHAAALPTVVPSQTRPAGSRAHRVSRVSYEHVQPFLQELLGDRDGDTEDFSGTPS